MIQLCVRGFALLALLFLASCSPIKGYPGPELPPEALSIVYLDSCDSSVSVQRSTSEGVEFRSSGVSLLPGARSFDLALEVGDQPFDCVPEQRVDEYAYRSCLEERARQRYEKKDKRNYYVRDCYISEFTETVYHCLRKYHQSICGMEATLLKGKEYDLCARRALDTAELYLYDYKTRAELGTKLCEKTGEEVRREELSSPY